MKKLLGALCALAILAVGCSASTTTVDDVASAEPDPTAETSVAEVATATPAPEPTDEPVSAIDAANEVADAAQEAADAAQEAADAVQEAEAAAVLTWAVDLTVGSCFDTASGEGATAVASAPIDCDEPHENEIFAMTNAPFRPDDAYPDVDVLVDGAYDEFCNPETERFGGEPWDELPFSVSVWFPTEEQWDSGDRTVACAAVAQETQDERLLIGTAAGGSLDSPDGVVSRATVNGQRDLYFSFEASSLYPLTNGEFDVQATAPHATSIGFLFAAPEQDATEPGARAYDYNYETGTVTQISTGLPDSWEIASPHFVASYPAFVFAAREAEADDWEIYRANNAEGAVALTDNDVDDRWPTIGPDDETIVFSSGGNIATINVDGSDYVELTFDGTNFESAVSPDGSRIAFASSRSGDDEIWVMNSDGSSPTNLTNHPADEAWPFWSLDGERLYFQTNRLGAFANLMMMEPDGSNPSWFARELVTNSALLPAAVTERFAAELIPLGGLPSGYDVVPGEPGDFTQIDHSSGRLEVGLPAGWEWSEVDTDQAAALVAAESIDSFDTTWAADGVFLTLYDVDDADAWRDVVAQASAAADCDEVDTGSQDEDGLLSLTLVYNCGDAIAWVVGVYSYDGQAGLLFEGQFDSDPDQASDEQVLIEISSRLSWR